VHTCTPLAKSALAPRTRQNELRVRSNAEFGPCPLPPDRHERSHMQHRLLHLRVRRARGQRKDRQVLGRVVSLAAAPSPLVVRKASTHRYLSFDPVTEHIASEMRLVLHSNKGKAGVFCRACLDLPSAACLPPARAPTPEWRGMAWPAPKLIRKPGAALLACSRLIRRTAYPADVGGAEQRSRHWPGSRRAR
jgi:hypothetical protein